MILVSMATFAHAADATPPTSDAGSAEFESWKLSSVLARGSADRNRLVIDLTQKSTGAREAALTVDEANAILDDPRAELIYGAKTVSIVAPSMLSRHRQEHLDLMAKFLAPEWLRAGADFSQKFRAPLQLAKDKTHVDSETVIAILLWESKLGAITGDYRIFNVFTSQRYFIDQANKIALAQAGESTRISEAAQKRRVETIRDRAHKNLVALIRQSKAKGIDALAVKGSWAGAIGFPQFMPASLHWAADGNGDDKIDLFDMDDAIMSIAHYLKSAGFARDRKKAVWAYNHEDAYVQGVLAYAEALKALAATRDGGNE